MIRDRNRPLSRGGVSRQRLEQAAINCDKIAVASVEPERLRNHDDRLVCAALFIYLSRPHVEIAKFRLSGSVLKSIRVLYEDGTLARWFGPIDSRSSFC